MADKTEHPAEPWTIQPDGDVSAANGNPACLYAPESMRRIVACVNACARIETETLEGFGGGLKDAFDVAQADKARADEAETLLATILLAIDACELADEIDAGLDEDDFCKQARAFINKANP